MAFVFAAAGAIGMSSTKLGQMASRVARIAGAQDDPNRVGAQDAIRDTLRKLNEDSWEYLGVTGTDIAFVSGTATYALPTPFHKSMSLRISGTNERPLGFVRQTDIDTALWTTTGQPLRWYSMWNSRQSGNFTLIGTPTFSGNVVMKYYRPVVIPYDSNEFIDVPDIFERFVKLDAQYQVGIEQDVTGSKLDRLALDRETALRGIRDYDRGSGPGIDDVFSPGIANNSSNFPSDHPYAYLDEDF